jgi:hypothetical protein
MVVGKREGGEESMNADAAMEEFRFMTKKVVYEFPDAKYLSRVEDNGFSANIILSEKGKSALQKLDKILDDLGVSLLSIIGHGSDYDVKEGWISINLLIDKEPEPMVNWKVVLLRLNKCLMLADEDKVDELKKYLEAL